MSTLRNLYFYALCAGWSACLGWLLYEFCQRVLSLGASSWATVVSSCMVGTAIACGLAFVAARVSGRMGQRLGMTLLVGIPVSAVAGFLGQAIYDMGLSHILGWVLMGMGIGSIDGLFERSPRKIRNGILGGAIGGLVGGLLFDPLKTWIVSGTGLSSRAISFTLLGLFIGGCIGLVQLLLREAWVIVMDGYQAGRQLTLTKNITWIGRSELADLPFLGPANKTLEERHLLITRVGAGVFQLEDQQTKEGSWLNSKPLKGATRLADNDLIRLGGNLLCYRERTKTGSASTAASVQVGSTMPAKPIAPPPPPPIRKTTAAASTINPPTAKAASNSLPTTIKPPRPLPPPGASGNISSTAPTIKPPPPPPPPPRKKP